MALHKSHRLLLVFLFVWLPHLIHANEIDEGQLGGWYMYFFNKKFEENRFGFQGDVQYRSWDTGGDLEQLLIRGGVTYRPEAIKGLYTLGLASITSGAFGDSHKTKSEGRLYQEALVPSKIGDRLFLKHRLRFEQRWVDGQDLRTRFRYALFATMPLNQPTLSKGAYYLTFYNEVFINGQRNIATNTRVDKYDRNRLYAALGYKLTEGTQIQIGYMRQFSPKTNKGQFQLSFHQQF